VRDVLVWSSGQLSVREETGADEPLDLSTEQRASAWVRASLADVGALRVMRRALARLTTADVTQWSDGDVAGGVARAIAARRVLALALHRPVGAARQPATDEATPPPTRVRTWVSVSLVDDASPPQPVPFEPFRLTLPNGSIYDGELDEQGRARVDGIDPGTCKITFPRLHGPDWRARR
jgi:hypothetical protein